MWNYYRHLLVGQNHEVAVGVSLVAVADGVAVDVVVLVAVRVGV